MACHPKCYLYDCSSWHKFLCDEGFEMLDVKRYEDGEQWIFHYENVATAPCYQKWRAVLGPIRNEVLYESKLLKLIEMVDVHRGKVHAVEEAKTEKVYEENRQHEKLRDELATDLSKKLMKHDDIQENLNRYGDVALTPEFLVKDAAKHAPWRLREMKDAVKGELSE